MMPIKNQTELNAILKTFNILPVFILDRTIHVGPDEMLYLMHDTNNQKIGIWARDYMDDLKYEARYLKTAQNLRPIKWLKADNDRVEIDGISYAVFLY